MKAFRTVTVAVAVLLVFSAYHAFAEDALHYEPSKTVVAVLPATTINTDKWKELNAKEAVAATEDLNQMFSDRGFNVVPVDNVSQAISTLNLDLKNEDQWTKANLIKAGQELHANLVAFILIKKVVSKTAGNFLASWPESDAEIEVWLVDVDQGRAILDDKPARGKAKRGMGNVTPRCLRAVKFAVEDGYKKALSKYPVIVNEKDRKNKEKDN